MLLDPIEISPMATEVACEVVARRIETFSLGDAKPPVAESGFAELYTIFRANLREALSACQEFALSPNYRSIKYSQSDEELLDALRSYLRETAERYESEAAGISPDALAVLRTLEESGGVCVGEAVTKLLGEETQLDGDSRLEELDRVGLAFVESDPSDNRRSSVRLTARAKVLLWAGRLSQ
ncbi:MAG: hypothetical protein ACRDX9_03470 [Acidimicrobiia bacterium]